MGNHWERNYKDSDSLLQATSDCLEIAGLIWEQIQLVNSLHRVQATYYLFMKGVWVLTVNTIGQNETIQMDKEEGEGTLN